MNGNKDLCEERGAEICNEKRQKRQGEVGVSNVKNMKEKKVDLSFQKAQPVACIFTAIGIEERREGSIRI